MRFENRAETKRIQTAEAIAMHIQDKTEEALLRVELMRETPHIYSESELGQKLCVLCLKHKDWRMHEDPQERLI